MGKISFLDTLKGIKITVSQGFDNEFLILGEEEKATALTLRFASLEHHTSVGFRVERFFQDVVIVTISLTKESKYIRRVLCNFDIFIDDKPLFSLYLDFFFIVFRRSDRSFSLDSFTLFTSLYLVNVPRRAILNSNRVQNELVLICVVIVLVDLEII